jgi:hypothetical protein
MRPSVNVVAALATAATFFAAVALPASAECKRYGFTVNDYGKDGPTKDAKSLLDKLIATKMSEQGVKDYKTGPKKVSCELFLNFIVFDEHTCTADATVCWGGTPLPSSEQAEETTEAGEKTKSSSAEPAKHSKKKKEVASKTSEAAKVTETAKATAPPPAENTAAETKAPDPKDTAAHTAETKEEAAQPAESHSNSAATTAAAPEATPASPSTAASETPLAAPAAAAAKAAKSVETGSLSESAKKPSAKHHEAKKAASGNGETTAVKPAAHEESGYPTPLPPEDGVTP